MSLATMSQALKTSNKSVTQPQAVTPPSAGVSGAAPKAAPQTTTPATGTLAPQTPQLSAMPDTSKIDKTNVADQLSQITASNSLPMRVAAAQGDRAAAARGMQGSSINTEASMRAMVDAALPMAQQNASQEFQQGMQESEVSANTIGKYIDYAQQITGNFDAQIAGIMNNTNMNATDKQNAINQLKTMRDSQLTFISNLFNKIPTTQKDWASFPNLGVPNITVG
ncbi:hypothetical protein SNE85_000828 [Vibrio cholerae]|uniref:hypothetical protein n=1 Tax=Vibrio cholerae TaxID=666 RepID=UPI0007C58A7D|nr:hypothetical protein [Vibrio cholerae]EKF9797542.1 hypothetical protein [Vibrio cholerae]ELY5178964.1 hypothetical protein [Vibrio cholerae]OAE83182.1 hypothetical protein AWJ09_04590 [Vibrio cholerae]